jgi:preprotein translocase subunit YajC
MFVTEAFAQSVAGDAGGLAGRLAGLQQILPFVLIFVVFYFLMIRPQQKKMKAHREMVAGLRRGDRVLIQGGIFGQVYKVISDTEVSVEIAEGVRVRVLKSAVGEVLAKTEPVAGGKDAPPPSNDAGDGDDAAPTGKTPRR